MTFFDGFGTGIQVFLDAMGGSWSSPHAFGLWSGIFWSGVVLNALWVAVCRSVAWLWKKDTT